MISGTGRTKHRPVSQMSQWLPAAYLISFFELRGHGYLVSNFKEAATCNGRAQRATGERNVQQASATYNRRAQRATGDPRHLTVGVLYTSSAARTHSENSVLKFHVNQMEHFKKKKAFQVKHF